MNTWFDESIDANRCGRGQRGPQSRPPNSRYDARWSKRLLILLALLLLLAMFWWTAPPQQPTPNEVDVVSLDTTMDASTLTAFPNGRDTIFHGTTTIERDKQFCFSLGEKVSQASDFWFEGGYYGATARLITRGGICPLGAGDINSVEKVPGYDNRPFLTRIFHPESGSRRYQRYARLVVGDCYAILCADRIHYAKIRVLAFERGAGRYPKLTFQWVYQANASTQFANEEDGV